MAHAVIAALGCSPGLGFVHIGHERSFVYDIADLYKAEITIPTAFEMAALHPGDELSGAVRRRVRDLMVENDLLERMVRDIKYLLLDDGEHYDRDAGEKYADSAVYLWDNRLGAVPNGISYGKDEKG